MVLGPNDVWPQDELDQPSDSHEQPWREVLEVRFTSLYAHMLLVFSVLFLGVSIWGMAMGHILPGVAGVLGSIVMFVGAWFWLNNLHLILRLDPDGLEVAPLKQTVQWADLERVELKQLGMSPKASRQICFWLKEAAKERYELPKKSALAKLTPLYDDDDFRFDDSMLDTPGDMIKQEVDGFRRMAAKIAAKQKLR